MNPLHRIRLAAAGALLVLLTVPALAELPTDKPPALPPLPPIVVAMPTDKPPPLTRGPADIPGPLCTIEHRPLLDQGLTEARARMAEAIRMVREDPDNPHVRRWFGSASRKVVLMTLELVAQRLDRTDELDLRCNDPGSCPGGRFAYARGRDLVLGVCPPFFRARMDGTDSRWGILIHEVSHIAANTVDHAYQPRRAMVLAKREPMRAAENADNYEYFVESMPRREAAAPAGAADRTARD